MTYSFLKNKWKGFQFLGQPLDISSFESNIRAITTSVNGISSTYVPGKPPYPFTQLLSTQGYFLHPLTDFQLTDSVPSPLPVSYNYALPISSGLSYVTIPDGFCFSIPFSAFSSSLHRVTTIGNTGIPVNWLPKIGLYQKKEFVSGVTYQISAASAFTVSNLCPTPTPSNTPSSTPGPTPIPTRTPTQTPTQSSTPKPTPTQSSTPKPTPTQSSTPGPTPTPTKTGLPCSDIAILKATYDFDNNLNAVESGVTRLTAIDPSSKSKFTTESVFGSIENVYEFNTTDTTTTGQAGLKVNVTGLIKYDDYTIEIVFRLFNNPNKYRKILDVSNRTKDSGLYIDPSNKFRVYPNSSTNISFNSNQWYKVVLTVRTASNINKTSVFVDGVLAVESYVDSLKINNPDNPNNILHFFLDDAQVPNEYSTGQVASIRLFDNAICNPKDLTTPRPTKTPNATPTKTPNATPTKTPNATPTKTPNATPVPPPTPNPTLTPYATVMPTKTPWPTPNPTNTPSPDSKSTFLILPADSSSNNYQLSGFTTQRSQVNTMSHELRFIDDSSSNNYQLSGFTTQRSQVNTMSHELRFIDDSSSNNYNISGFTTIRSLTGSYPLQ
jgi:hypothetical protein